MVGKYVYSAGSGRLQTFGATDGHLPVVRGDGWINGLASDVYVSGHHQHVPLDGELEIFDVSDPTTAHAVGMFKSGYNGWDGRVAGHHACLMDRGANLHVIDVSDPSAPKEVGGLGTGNFCSKVLSLTNFVAGKSPAEIQTAAGGPITDALTADGTLRISDPDAHRFSNRFYRAIKTP